MDYDSYWSIASPQMAIWEDADPPDELAQRCDVKPCL
jgi:hypothetical protein